MSRSGLAVVRFASLSYPVSASTVPITWSVLSVAVCSRAAMCYAARIIGTKLCGSCGLLATVCSPMVEERMSLLLGAGLLNAGAAGQAQLTLYGIEVLRGGKNPSQGRQQGPRAEGDGGQLGARRVYHQAPLDRGRPSRLVKGSLPHCCQGDQTRAYLASSRVSPPSATGPRVGRCRWVRQF
jgi:hypothetical protein